MSILWHLRALSVWYKEESIVRSTRPQDRQRAHANNGALGDVQAVRLLAADNPIRGRASASDDVLRGEGGGGSTAALRNRRGGKPSALFGACYSKYAARQGCVVALKVY
jgi:hypothetical protein